MNIDAKAVQGIAAGLTKKGKVANIGDKKVKISQNVKDKFADLHAAILNEGVLTAEQKSELYGLVRNLEIKYNLKPTEKVIEAYDGRDHGGD